MRIVNVAVVAAAAAVIVAPIVWLSKGDARRAQEFRAAGEAALAAKPTQHSFRFKDTTYLFVHDEKDPCKHYAFAQARPNKFVNRKAVHQPFYAPNCKHG